MCLAPAFDPERHAEVESEGIGLEKGRGVGHEWSVP